MRFLLISLLFMAGCSSVVTARHDHGTITQNGKKVPKDMRTGLVYYMPRQDIIFTVTVAKEDEGSSNSGGSGGSNGSNSSGGTAEKSNSGGKPPGEGSETDTTPGKDDDTNGASNDGEQQDDDQTPSEPASSMPSFGGTVGPLTVNVTTTPPYPDRSQAYWLQFGTNWLGKNTLNIGISPAGLLQSTKSTTEPGISDALTSLARVAAYSVALVDDKDDDPCNKGTEGTYIYRIELPAESSGPHCGFSVSAKEIDFPDGRVPIARTPSRRASGIYYRQAIPYVVTVERNGYTMTGVLYSPSDSETYFLRARRTLFARNEAEFTFKDGMPTLYKQEADGELVALAKLPADVLGAYFGAIGEVFGQIAAKPTGEAELIQAQMNLEHARFRQEQCRTAIEANNTDVIAATCSAPAAPAAEE